MCWREVAWKCYSLIIFLFFSQLLRQHSIDSLGHCLRSYSTVSPQRITRVYPSLTILPWFSLTFCRKCKLLAYHWRLNDSISGNSHGPCYWPHKSWLSEFYFLYPLMHNLTLLCSGCPEGSCLEPDYSIEIRRLFISPTTQQSSLVKVSTVIILLIYTIQVAPHSSLSSLHPAFFHSPNHSSHLSSKFPVSLAFMRWIYIFLSLPLVSM